jgi:hypothetical protein
MVNQPSRVRDEISRDERYADAMAFMKSTGASMERAASSFNVSKTTLHRRVKGTVALGARAGRKPILSPDDEEGIVETILFRSKCGMCMTDGELRILVRQVALGKEQPVPDMFPSSKFPTRFVARHKGRLTRKQAQIRDVKRYEMSTEERVCDFHKNLQEAMRVRVPDQIWNCDETGFCPQGRKPPRVICRKGMKANVLQSKDRDNVSVMACVSAAGERLPPMFIFPGKKRQLEWMKGATDGAVCDVSDSPYINGFLFLLAQVL